jgi:Fe-Mn family superoxide dismutase
MTPYSERTFSLPEIPGISSKQIDVHLKLYQGYVKHTNLILQRIEELSKERETNGYTIAELRRRFGFEFNGMRNHEYYFGNLEGGAHESDSDSALGKAFTQQFGSIERWRDDFKAIAAETRGDGWVMLLWDDTVGRFLNSWITNHELGQLTGLEPIVALDMFEHAYMVDYVPADKKLYVSAYLDALNWNTIEKNFASRIIKT